MSEKKPQTGEWWECDFTRVRIVGHRLDGVAITEAIGGFIGCIENEFGWKHLPDCDSFEWQPEPVESPDDWVEFDGGLVAFPRLGIDELKHATESSFEPAIQAWRGKSQQWQVSMVNYKVRCRRKDIPPMPQRPNYVRLWTHRTSGTVCTATDERYLKYPDIWSELKHDGTGFYLSDDGK